MIIDWGKPFELQTPYADIDFNRADGIGMKFVPEECSATYEVRADIDNVPQSDGYIPHFRFKTGYTVRLAADLWATKDQIACDEDITSLGETLDGALSSILNPPDQLGRLIWTPPGHGTYPGARMFDFLQLREAPVPVQQPQGAIRVRWTMDTKLPYAIDLAERDITINGGGLITNAGNVPYWPVIKVYGAPGGTNSFVIVNFDTEQSMTYDVGPTIPAGQYLEINTFNNTAFLNGDQANDLDGFNVEITDFFALAPGDNNLLTNVEAVFLMNNSWA